MDRAVADQAARRRFLPGGHRTVSAVPGPQHAGDALTRRLVRRAGSPPRCLLRPGCRVPATGPGLAWAPARTGMKSRGSSSAARSTAMDIDARGPRFAAVITTVVLAFALVTTSMWLLLAQALVFAVGAVAGMRYAPYGLVCRFLIRPRLGPPTRFEPAAPPRFAQSVGTVFAAIGVIGYAVGVTGIGIAFTALALAAAFLNAAFDFCLGCQICFTHPRILPVFTKTPGG